MELNYIYGKKYTEEMRKGKQIHESLQSEVFVPLMVEPVTYADYLYKKGYESYMAIKTLEQKGICRELHIYGSLDGYKVEGQIDELRNEAGKTKLIELKTVQASTNTKISQDPARIKPNVVQIMLYRKLLDDVINGRYTLYNFTKSYAAAKMQLSEPFRRGLHAIGLEEKYANLEEIFRLMFDQMSRIPQLSDKLEIRYVDRFSGKLVSSIEINYSESEINKDLQFALKYWNGEREALPVSENEKWKCNLCKFYGKECKVWWK